MAPGELRSLKVKVFRSVANRLILTPEHCSCLANAFEPRSHLWSSFVLLFLLLSMYLFTTVQL